MIKVFDGVKWVVGNIVGPQQVQIKSTLYMVDADGFIRLGKFRFRLFSADYIGEIVGAFERVG